MQADPATIQQANLIIAKAASRGTDAGRALSELGLLHHAALRRQIMSDLLTQTADLLDVSQIKSLAGRGRVPATPLDTKRLIVDWLRVQAQQVQR